MYLWIGDHVNFMIKGFKEEDKKELEEFFKSVSP
jgi:hypothetical protein